MIVSDKNQSIVLANMPLTQKRIIIFGSDSTSRLQEFLKDRLDMCGDPTRFEYKLIFKLKKQAKFTQVMQAFIEKEIERLSVSRDDLIIFSLMEHRYLWGPNKATKNGQSRVSEFMNRLSTFCQKYAAIVPIIFINQMPMFAIKVGPTHIPDREEIWNKLDMVDCHMTELSENYEQFYLVTHQLEMRRESVGRNDFYAYALCRDERGFLVIFNDFFKIPCYYIVQKVIINDFLRHDIVTFLDPTDKEELVHHLSHDLYADLPRLHPESAPFGPLRNFLSGCYLCECVKNFYA